MVSPALTIPKIDFQKTKQSRTNNALKPIKDDDDLSAAIDVAKRIYEVTHEQPILGIADSLSRLHPGRRRCYLVRKECRLVV